MADPYVYSNGTLRNKLEITDAEELALAESDITKARLTLLESAGSSGTLTFERLRQIHFYIFQDLYDWAGRLRTVELAKQDYVGGRLTQFTSPSMIEAAAQSIDTDLATAAYLAGMDRRNFAASASVFFGRINQLHPFRDGNGRAQRAFMGALARNAGLELSFDVLSRERMLEASIQAVHGNTQLLYRLFTEISDSSRVKALRTAIDFLESHGYGWNDRYIATMEPNRTYHGIFVGRDELNFMIHDGQRILIGSIDELADQPESGDEITLTTKATIH